MVKVRASSGVIECFRFPLDPPVPHVHVPRSSHPIPSILDDNPECDPLPSFAFAPDHHEGLGIVLEAVPLFSGPQAGFGWARALRRSGMGVLHVGVM